VSIIEELKHQHSQNVCFSAILKLLAHNTVCELFWKVKPQFQQCQQLKYVIFTRIESSAASKSLEASADCCSGELWNFKLEV
jgi:hypothetical protein